MCVCECVCARARVRVFLRVRARVPVHACTCEGTLREVDEPGGRGVPQHWLLNQPTRCRKIFLNTVATVSEVSDRV
jgi:hypothetical protein